MSIVQKAEQEFHYTLVLVSLELILVATIKWITCIFNLNQFIPVWDNRTGF